MSKDPPPIAELRAQAQRYREFALDLLPRDPGARRLREIADDLEAQAEALERQRDAP
jgi:PHD/YefM family antitoxin component YafN of YafNO toxin-antitoxin module